MTRTIALGVNYALALEEASNVIQGGGVIVYPTETLYGIGADALNATAVQKVLAAKKRKDDKPLLAIVHSREMLCRIAASIPETAERLMEAFWPGPLTLIFVASADVPKELTQSTGTIGVRIPSHRFCLDLAERCGCPITSTSANISGEPVHRTIEEIRQALNEGIDLFVDAGTLPESKPSTVVSVVHDPPRLLREGVIDLDRLRTVLPTIQR
ncbi:MAG TPA: L-threonylcarbamoyladenylate synthase [Bacteroidota bacterium]|nr:L-threonylcarbamoyladenylate synthase [Bacteroidota bacterium]